MDEVICEVCVKDFDDIVTIPRVLTCGHTVCTDCITQLIQSSQICPKCRRNISCSSSDEYPINYAVIGMADSLKNSVTLQTFLQRRIETLKKKYTAMETKFTEAKVNLDDNLELIASGLDRIQELADEDDNMEVNATNQIILNLNNQLDDIRNCSILNKRKLKCSTTLHFCDFQNSDDFLFEIYNRVSNGEQFYAVTRIDEKVKFSRISVWSNKLLFHAFGSSKDEPQIKTVWFQDIKRCLTDNNYLSFLEVCCNDRGMKQTILIQPTNTSLVPQFLKFCTGELGPAYKGTSFRGGGNDSLSTQIIVTDNYLHNGIESKGNFEYTSCLNVYDYNKSYAVNDLIVTGAGDGSFKILLVKNSTSFQFCLGKVIEPLDLLQKISHGNNRKIFDCGIALNLN